MIPETQGRIVSFQIPLMRTAAVHNHEDCEAHQGKAGIQSCPIKRASVGDGRRLFHRSLA
jgi:hypothetical protein